MDKEKLIESVRARLTAVAVAVIAVITLFAGMFPELGLPVAIDIAVAEPFIRLTAYLVMALVTARTFRNTKSK